MPLANPSLFALSRGYRFSLESVKRFDILSFYPIPCTIPFVQLCVSVVSIIFFFFYFHEITYEINACTSINKRSKEIEREKIRIYVSRHALSVLTAHTLSAPFYLTNLMTARVQITLFRWVVLVCFFFLTFSVVSVLSSPFFPRTLFSFINALSPFHHCFG